MPVDSITGKRCLLCKAEQPSPRRIGLVTGGTTASYGAMLLGLNYIWYADFPRSDFHFFNDAKEWQQIDKMGHMHTAYFYSGIQTEMYRWAGLSDKRAAWVGATSGFLMQTVVELLDGFSEKWGASFPDAVANLAGSGLYLGQELAWGEQRLQLKYSLHNVDYPKGMLKDRANDLYGTGPERLIKDYNGIVIWLSANPSSFNQRKQRIPWLNVALGYGAGGMYGGFENSWYDDNGNLVDRTDIPRFRQFFLSPDVDFTKIPARGRFGKVCLYLLNVFKMPAPALEFNTEGEIIFHPIFFLNWDQPLYLKR